MSQIDLTDLEEMLTVADVVIAFTADDRSRWHCLKGDTDHVTLGSKVGAVRCVSTCQRLVVATMLTLQDFGKFDRARFYQCGALLESTARCSCVVAPDLGIRCEARESVSA